MAPMRIWQTCEAERLAGTRQHRHDRKTILGSVRNSGVTSRQMEMAVLHSKQAMGT